MADVPESSLNPHPPEHIPISTPPPPPPPPPRRPMYVLRPLPMPQYLPVMLQRPQFLPVMLPRYQFLPVMQLPPCPYPAAFPPLLALPTVVSPPQENVRRRRSIPPRLRWVEKWIPNNETTVMIKNIPFHYDRGLMIRFLDDFCLQENEKARYSNGENIHVFAYDYLYLPLDTIMNRIKGYAFVNFTDKRSLWNFILAFSDGVKVFPGSNRRVELAIAYIQGENALRRQFQNAKYASEAIGFYPPRDGY
uniref:Terminal ear1-like 2 protein n=1 Tax=Solanum tuberosum TaxID=4113 RepID=M1DBG8_SOLTU